MSITTHSNTYYSIVSGNHNVSGNRGINLFKEKVGKIGKIPVNDNCNELPLVSLLERPFLNFA